MRPGGKHARTEFYGCLGLAVKHEQMRGAIHAADGVVLTPESCKPKVAYAASLCVLFISAEILQSGMRWYDQLDE